jgi:hypothetical protein
MVAEGGGGAMDPALDGTPEKNLRRYATRVAHALGLAGDRAYVSSAPPASIYLALDQCLPAAPDRDVALLWDADHGWALAVETHSGEDMIVLSHLAGDRLPSPRVVARFVRRALIQEHPRLPKTG